MARYLYTRIDPTRNQPEYQYLIPFTREAHKIRWEFGTVREETHSPTKMACNVATSSVSVDTFSKLFTNFYAPTNSPYSSSLFSHSNIILKYKSHTINSKNHPKSHSTICRAAEYQFPDPIPEFADSETEKFKAHLIKKLSKKDIYGDELDEVVGICTEIFSTFMHAEYGGPGTLLVLPFIDMADTLNEQGLNGGPQAARAAVKWAQANVDKDWKEWTSSKN